MAFQISEDDIAAVALLRGIEISDETASKWYDRLNHDAIESYALNADEMDEQTSLAFEEIDRQLDDLGCWDKQKSELAATELDASTVSASFTRSRRV